MLCVNQCLTCTISRSYCKPHHRKQLQLASFQGSISMSMSLHQTSFCFICSHLASGEKEGDKLRRNFDLMETLRKTKFSQVHGFWDQTTPERILEHEWVIPHCTLISCGQGSCWEEELEGIAGEGSGSCLVIVWSCNLTDNSFLAWKLESFSSHLPLNQLQIEQQSGCVFQGWNEGRIYFPPTYKYMGDACNGDLSKELTLTAIH